MTDPVFAPAAVRDPRAWDRLGPATLVVIRSGHPFPVRALKGRLTHDDNRFNLDKPGHVEELEVFVR